MDKKQAILDAAQTLLARHGFHGFSMKQLAGEAGIAAGTVYLYFRDKDTLIGELHRHIVAHVAQEISTALDASQPVRDQLIQAWHTLWAMTLKHPERLLCKNQFDSLPPESNRKFFTTAQHELKPLVDLFDKARADGLLKPLPNQALMSLWIEPCIGLARKQLLGVVQLDDDVLQQVALASWHAIAKAGQGSNGREPLTIKD